jgi:hypothetical protein
MRRKNPGMARNPRMRTGRAKTSAPMTKIQTSGPIDSSALLDPELLDPELLEPSGFGARTIGNRSRSKNRIRKNQGFAIKPRRSPGVNIRTNRKKTSSARKLSLVSCALVRFRDSVPCVFPLIHK